LVLSIHKNALDSTENTVSIEEEPITSQNVDKSPYFLEVIKEKDEKLKNSIFGTSMDVDVKTKKTKYPPKNTNSEDFEESFVPDLEVPQYSSICFMKFQDFEKYGSLVREYYEAYRQVHYLYGKIALRSHLYGKTVGFESDLALDAGLDRAISNIHDFLENSSHIQPLSSGKIIYESDMIYYGAELQYKPKNEGSTSSHPYCTITIFEQKANAMVAEVIQGSHTIQIIPFNPRFKIDVQRVQELIKLFVEASQYDQLISDSQFALYLN
ncbi:MAG: hypothetical protein MHPSP_002695, partial [Paramarteilia canceri]